MADRVYRKVEVVGISAESVDDAIRTAVAKAAQSIGSVDWFEMTEIRGKVDNGSVEAFQVSLIVGVRIDS